uniref:AKIN gamma n=1 Tax=Rhizophora mucronata TaxID=61149 RepID=A0A2P2NH63_RHIMU
MGEPLVIKFPFSTSKLYFSSYFLCTVEPSASSFMLKSNKNFVVDMC